MIQETRGALGRVAAEGVLAKKIHGHQIPILIYRKPLLISTTKWGYSVAAIESSSMKSQAILQFSFCLNKVGRDTRNIDIYQWQINQFIISSIHASSCNLSNPFSLYQLYHSFVTSTNLILKFHSIMLIGGKIRQSVMLPKDHQILKLSSPLFSLE